MHRIKKSKESNKIKFKTVAKAKKFLEQLQSIHSKYSRRYYWREGKTVYRD
jgi:hypothetical protein